MPIEAYKELFAFKQEVTPGTPVELASADVVKVRLLDVQPNLELVERSYTDNVFTRLAHVVSGKWGSLTISVDLAGSGVAGTPAPKWAPLLLGCGLKSADQKAYTLTNTVADYKTYTVGVEHEGNFKSLAGTMGSFKISGGDGQVGTVEFTLQGVWQTTAAPLGLTAAADVVPPLCNGGTFTWNAQQRAITQFTFDGGVNVTKLRDMAAAARYYRAWIEGRSPSATFDPEMITGQSMWADYEAGTERALAIGVGTAAGNKVAIAAGACQITQLSDGKRDGVRIHNATVKPNGAAAYSITWL